MKKIAVIIEKSKCSPNRCQHECIKFDPVNRSGGIGFHLGGDGKAAIDEKVATEMHKICAKKCPFSAINIVKLPQALKEEPIHRFGNNGFMLYGLPFFKENKVTGIIGRNGIGKSTALNILSGNLVPNLGYFDKKIKEDEVIQRYSKVSLGEYFKKLYNKKIKFSYKPQRVELISKEYNGKVIDLLNNVDEKNQSSRLIEDFELEKIKNRNIKDLSGGELQKVAIIAAYVKKADYYFFDEPSSFCDIKNRIKLAKLIKELSKNSSVIVVDHDLATLDYVSDEIQIIYGEPGAYGIFSQSKGINRAINEYLEGNLKEENIKYREYSINFNPLNFRREYKKEVFLNIPNLKKNFKDFSLNVNGFNLHKGQVIAIMGANGLGKSTFLNIISGKLLSDSKKFKIDNVAYKEQDLESSDLTVNEFLINKSKEILTDKWMKSNLIEKLNLERLYEEKMKVLSGGELQKVNIAGTLCKESEVVLMDEPSAFIDVEDRLKVAEIIKDFALTKEICAIIVDHDIQFIDYLADSILIFEGIPGKEGKVFGPFDKLEGMNRVLKNLNITYRKDNLTNRARINKEGSQLDEEQKRKGEYY